VLSAGTRRVVTSKREFVTADKAAAYVCARPCESAYPARVSFMETTTATRRIARVRAMFLFFFPLSFFFFSFSFFFPFLFLVPPFSFSNDDIAPRQRMSCILRALEGANE